jgi:Haem-binding domain
MVKKFLKWALAIIVVAFALIQIPDAGRTNPSVTPGHDLLSTNAPPPQIAATLRSACYDCHSYETHWPWYGYVAPVSWFLAGHVRDARERLNFSEWPHEDAQQAAKKWNHISHSVRDGDMPLPSYAKIHKAARISDEQRKALADWAEQESQQLKSASAVP